MSHRTFQLCMALAITVGILAADGAAQTAGLSHRVEARVGGSLLATAVVYSQPPSGTGVFYASSSTQNDYDNWVWDEFTLPNTQTLTEIRWRGAYDPSIWPQYTGPVVDFIVGIYATSIAGEPDRVSGPLIEYQAFGNAGETPAGTFGGIAMYDYSLILDTPFTAVGGTQYWVQIEGQQAGIPSWAIADGTGGNGTHAWAFVNYAGGQALRMGVAGDAAFTLLAVAPEAVVAGIAASGNDVRLSWTHLAPNSAYEIHRSLTPYFTPDASTLLRTLTAPASSYLDAGAVADANNYYYIVRATYHGLAADSAEAGKFRFALVPGQ